MHPNYETGISIFLRTGSALVAALAITCTAVSSATAQPAPKQLKYVALGDSYAAAPSVPEPAPPLGCGKSTNNYPSVLAHRLTPSNFTDVTCGGATTNDIMHQQNRPRRARCHHRSMRSAVTPE